MDMISVSPATPADVPTILSFIRELAEYEKLLDRVVATERRLRETLFGPRPYAEVLIGRLDGRGVGKALLREIARVARARGCGRIEWSVLDWNKPSIDFYLSLGATPMDEW